MNKFNQIDRISGCLYSSIIFLFYLWPLNWAICFITLSRHLKCRITDSFQSQSSATAWSGSIEAATYFPLPSVRTACLPRYRTRLWRGLKLSRHLTGWWLSACTLSHSLPARSRWPASVLSLKLHCYSNSTVSLACRWVPLSPLWCLHATLWFLLFMLHLYPWFSKHLR